MSSYLHYLVTCDNDFSEPQFLPLLKDRAGLHDLKDHFQL